MITNDVSTCPKCGGDLKYYDRVTRIVRTKGRKSWKIPMRRLQCTRCGSVHRELPELIGYYFNDKPFTTYKGTYKYTAPILTLTYDETDYPLIVKDGVIYFLTFSK